MCDSANEGPVKRQNNRNLRQGFCHKCKELKPQTVIRNTLLCKSCFIDTIIHRFRTNIFKINKPSEPRVLIACSGGPSSIAMLELMAGFCRIDPLHTKRRPRYPFIHCCHVDQSAIFHNPQLADKVQEACKQQNVSFSVVKLESVLTAASTLKKNGNITVAESLNIESSVELLTRTLKSAGNLTSQEDLVDIYTKQAIFKEAERLNCNIILLGDNSNNLAIKVISNTAKGRGVSLSYEVALQHQYGNFLVVKPLRDTLAKEIGIYNQFQNLTTYFHPNITTGKNRTASIGRITADFINGLQSEFPSTVSTIARTAFKIPSLVTDESECVVCQGPLDIIEEVIGIDMSFSSKLEHFEEIKSFDEVATASGQQTNKGQDLYKDLCYGCRNIARDMERYSSRPVFASHLLLLSKEEMKNEINEFLLPQ